ncbi:MAG: delta-60 repeat domain-containing protein [Saccharospirillum sp.]|nr:delta-60 repeat domain-containing protein [Saccharospirillum sp.]
MKRQFTRRILGSIKLSLLMVLTLLFGLAGCGGGGSGSSVGGEVTGLSVGGSLTIADGSSTLEILGNGSFTLPGSYSSGDSYNISVQAYPAGQGCEVSNGSGSVGGQSVTNVGIYCFGLPELTAVSGIMEMTLSWSGPDSVDILYSTDRDCDWSNHGVCANAGMLTSVAGYERVLGSVADDFAADKGWYFVAERAGFRSPVSSARPVPVSFDGAIWSQVMHEDTLMVGGEFQAAGMGVGGGGVASLGSGHPVGPMPEITRWVYDAVPDDEGGWIIGGDFTSIDGEPRQFLARIRADGTLDPDWDVSFEGSWIWRMARVGDRVFVVGNFSEVNGEPRSNIAAFSISGGGELDVFEAPIFDDFVDSLIVTEDTVYVGGRFSDVGGAPRNRLAALDSTTGALDATWVPSASGGNILDMAFSNGHVYLGGAFDEINGVPRRLGRVDTDTGALDVDFNPELDNSVNRLLVANDTLFVGGYFTASGLRSRTYLAAFSLLDHTLLDWNPLLDGSVWALAYDNDRLYVGGGFLSAEGEPRRHAAAFDMADDGQLLGWAPESKEWLYGLAPQGSSIYLAGGSPGSVTRERLAAIDLTTGMLTDWSPSASGTVRVLKVHGSNVYVGGNFTELNGTDRVGIGRLHLENGALGDWHVNADSSIRAMHIRGSTLYVGGAFTEIAGTSQSRTAAFNLNTGTLIAGFEPDIDNTVYAITSTDDWLYIGGNFSNVGGESLQSLAAISFNTGVPDEHWDAGIASGIVHHLGSTSERLYAGGSFSPYRLIGYDLTVAGRPRSDTWQPTVTASIIGTPLVYDIVEWGDRVFVAGRFSELNMGEEVESLMALDRTDGSLLTDWAGSVGRDRTHTLLADPLRNRLYVGGSFRELSGSYRRNLGSIDPESGEVLW